VTYDAIDSTSQIRMQSGFEAGIGELVESLACLNNGGLVAFHSKLGNDQTSEHVGEIIFTRLLIPPETLSSLAHEMDAEPIEVVVGVGVLKNSAQIMKTGDQISPNRIVVLKNSERRKRTNQPRQCRLQQPRAHRQY